MVYCWNHSFHIPQLGPNQSETAFNFSSFFCHMKYSRHFFVGVLHRAMFPGCIFSATGSQGTVQSLCHVRAKTVGLIEIYFDGAFCRATTGPMPSLEAKMTVVMIIAAVLCFGTSCIVGLSDFNKRKIIEL